ncbi:carbonic anhydrase [Kribbella sandramycini]|uniref:carbonic anhydrase n=1 Tax=Kribbella sandramycini TaxID=60450 RepID=A0A7Y4NYB8_9ACTN|nr:carbonic anhydrase [Kribbella sandramycini]MBB6569359.1 carbonic anhydrase [Kribbella sandramycini]NOL40802.1 carbonic anhydrase [Kribbella sandramycini]
MTTPGFEDLLAANAEYAADFHYGGFDGIAQAGVGVVTCMDSRIPPLEMLGLKPGDAKVLRSAGGRVTEITLSGLVLGVQLLGVRRIMIIPHTRCAMAAMSESELRAKVAKASGKPAGYLPINVIPDQLEALNHDVVAVREHPLIGDDILVGGFMYDVDSGKLTQHD